jgi:hypothetical protein
VSVGATGALGAAVGGENPEPRPGGYFLKAFQPLLP